MSTSPRWIRREEGYWACDFGHVSPSLLSSFLWEVLYNPPNVDLRPNPSRVSHFLFLFCFLSSTIARHVYSSGCWTIWHFFPLPAFRNT